MARKLTRVALFPGGLIFLTWALGSSPLLVLGEDSPPLSSPAASSPVSAPKSENPPAGESQAEESIPSEAPAKPPKSDEPPRRHWWGGGTPRAPLTGPDATAFENVRKAIDALTPEQRKQFQENVSRWANLSPEQKRELRDREQLRRKFIEDEVNAAIQEIGVPLSPEQREKFIRRYKEERRGVEEQLRKEMAEKRRPLVRAILARLKTEFAQPPASTSTASTPPVSAATPPVVPTSSP